MIKSSSIFSNFTNIFTLKAAAAGLGLAAALTLAGCGFHLRGAGEQLNLPFKTVYLGFPENSPLGLELTRNLRANGSTVVSRDPKAANAIIEVLSETRDKAILSLNFQGRVREYSLTYTFRFRVKDQHDVELLKPTEISLKRSISFNESQVLAKEAEENLLYRDMQTDLVQQIIRRLAAIKPAPTVQ
jgi:LPS-assembly lipoprotein